MAHVTALRSEKELKRAKIISIIERNFGLCAPRYTKALLRLGNVKPVCEEENVIGVNTDAVSKLAASNVMKRLVHNSQLCFWDKWKCANPFFMASKYFKTPKEELLSKLYDQMGKFRYVRYRGRTTHGRESVTVSGKVDSKGKTVDGQNDDLIIAASLAFMWGERDKVHGLKFFKNVKFPKNNKH